MVECETTAQDLRELKKHGTDRAEAHRWRAERAETCQQSSIRRTECHACGNVDEHPVSCGLGLLCHPCRQRIAAKRRQSLEASQHVVRGRATNLGLMRHNRYGGAWGERMMTLTLPRDPKRGIKDRVDLVRRAWARMRRALRTWWKKLYQREHREIRWSAHLEWTPGSDGLGHPHIHCWIFGPWVDQHQAWRMWQDSLWRSGLSLDIVDTAIRPDLRKFEPGTGLAELIKYTVKDLTADGRLPPELWAEVYEALDGQRQAFASRGLVRLGATLAACSCCEAVGHLHTSIQRAPTAPAIVMGQCPPPQATAPP
jgi:hypothetical protein